jgi:hypothetical protein
VESDAIVVRILNTPPRATVHRNALGYAQGNRLSGGGLVTILLDRVAETASYAHVALGRLLGRVLVHEIGHLGTLTHSRDGVMRDRWTVEQLHDDDPRLWGFSPAQSARMRAAFLTFELAARRWADPPRESGPELNGASR